MESGWKYSSRTGVLVARVSGGPELPFCKACAGSCLEMSLIFSIFVPGGQCVRIYWFFLKAAGPPGNF